MKITLIVLAVFIALALVSALVFLLSDKPIMPPEYDDYDDNLDKML